MEHIVTVESVLKHNPCYRDTKGNYDADRIRGIVGDGIPLIDVLRLALDGRFPAEDAIWYATRDGVLDQKARYRWMEAIVTRAITNHALGTCIDDWAKRWLSGDDRSKESATVAARSASYASAAAFAAWAAEAEAADAASWAAWAAWAEAEEAEDWYGEEAAEAAEAAERLQQFADLIAILEDQK